VKNKENNILKKYEFDYIFSGDNTQHDIYKEVFPLIHSLFKGDNVIILSYGQKNSGKSYTIFGENNDKGIIGRAMQEIFYILNEENKDKYSEYNISMNIININNNGIFNLLEEATPQLDVKENSKGELLVEDLISINIKSFEECDKLFKLSKKFQNDYKNNGSEKNFLNCVYSFNIKLIEKEGNIVKTNLTFIDLGNKNKDEEYKNINYVIDEHNDLYNFLICLSHNKIDEYEDWNKSLLVHYLKKNINEKRYKLMLFLNLSQDTKEIEQTLKTLKFGEGIISDNYKK
jgi:kinesin family protein 13